MIYKIEGGYANTYLIEGEEGLVAIDVGSRLAAEKIVDFITINLGRESSNLRLITATHFHVDHIGGISELKKRCSQAEINFLFRVDKYLTGEEKLCIPPLAGWFMSLVPVFIRLNPHFRNAFQAFISKKAGIPLPLLRNFTSIGYQPKCELKEGLEIPHLLGWEVIETPGHTQDSICFYRPDDHILISGDTILNMEGTGELNKFCCSHQDIKNSLRRLSTLDVENIYPGHGAPILGVKKALSKVKS